MSVFPLRQGQQAPDPGPRLPTAPEDPSTVAVPVRTGVPPLTLRRAAVHGLLFAATIASTSLMVSPLYSVCLMSILTAHEFGHYLAARHHRVPATLPYFLPAPFIFGTMGAVIRMSPLIPDRRALFDIASAGPLAGVVLAIPISFVGMSWSEYVPLEEDFAGALLGDPLLFQLFERVLHGQPQGDMVLLLHDAAFAGWVGLFVTALNLLPMGQLDGGHVAYAVFGRRSRFVAYLAFAILAVVSIATEKQYLLLLLLLLVTGLRHRPTLNESVPLGQGRRRLALLLLAIFAACFVPVPIQFQL